jgi:hypothetical protein
MRVGARASSQPSRCACKARETTRLLAAVTARLWAIAAHGLHDTQPMLDTMKDFMSSVGCTTTDIAKRVGDGTVDIARRVGPKRGIIGFIVLGAAIGGSIYLIRYLRARSAELEGATNSDRSSTLENRERRARETARSLQH